MRQASIRAGQLTIDFLLEANETNGSATMFEFTVPAGAKVPVPHYHENFDEVVYGLEGVMTYTVGDQTVDIRPGESCYVGRGVPHGFDNLHTIDAKALAVITPGLLGSAYFREIAEIINAGGPPDIEKLKAVMAKHGLVPIMSGG